MATKVLLWILGVVVVVGLGGWAWRASVNDDTATSTATTTPDVSSGNTGGSAGQGGAGTSASGSGSATPGNLPSGDYTLDTEASVITWTGTKPRILGYADTGTVALKSGTLKVADGNIIAGDFFINMDTIAVTTTSSTKGTKEMLVSHLKSADFFNVTSYPNAHFKITSVARGTVTGELTVTDITKTISFPAAIRAEGDTTGTFFDDLGDNLIDDQVKITLDLVATK
jgi:polyisoprenoid-binding protein YceI